MTLCCPNCGSAFAASAKPATLECPECRRLFRNPLPAVEPDEASSASGESRDDEDDRGEVSIVEDETFVRDTMIVFRWLLSAFVANFAAGVMVFVATYRVQFDMMFGDDGQFGMFLFNLVFQWAFPLVACVLLLGAISLKRRESYGFVQTSLPVCLLLAAWWVGVGVFCLLKTTTAMYVLAGGSFVVAVVSVVSACFAYPLVMNVDFQTRFSNSARMKTPEPRRRRRRNDDDDYDD